MGTWMELANNWNQNVTQVMGLGLQGRGQNIQVQQYGIQNAFELQGLLSRINQGNYGALTGQAQNIYGVNKENAAASYAAQQAVGQGVSDIGQATSGALSGMSYASAAQQGLGGGMGGYSNNPYASNALYNTPSSSSGVYYGGKPATGSMSDRPYAIPT